MFPTITESQKNYIKVLCSKHNVNKQMYLKVMFQAIGEFKRLDEMTLTQGQNMIHILRDAETFGSCDPTLHYHYDTQRMAELNQFLQTVTA